MDDLVAHRDHLLDPRRAPEPDLPLLRSVVQVPRRSTQMGDCLVDGCKEPAITGLVSRLDLAEALAHSVQPPRELKVYETYLIACPKELQEPWTLRLCEKHALHGLSATRVAVAEFLIRETQATKPAAGISPGLDHNCEV